ncbi:MAG: cytochrome P450 [Gammaproteobacteria bacterium]|nr:cytochrome P450 [Gammaproteobacteria bacterium]
MGSNKINNVLRLAWSAPAIIIRIIIRRLKDHRLRPIITVSWKAMRQKKRLPPGEFVALEPAERSDQQFLLKQSQRIGPVFKAIWGRRFCTCMVGLPLCRRFLEQHSDDLTPQSLELESFFAKGFLRRMQGEDHKKYRRLILKSIDSQLITRDSTLLEKIVADELAVFKTQQKGDTGPPERYIKTLKNIADQLLIYSFFGAQSGSDYFEKLETMYNLLGPNGLEWFPEDKHKRTFNAIRDYLLNQLDEHRDNEGSGLQRSIVGRMYRAGGLDETSLGNLIYMVEMGRYDMRLLFRWLSKYAAENPALLERIAAGKTVDHEGRVSLQEAFVLETFRLNQSERLMRIANRDINFEGYFIPKESLVRLCLWESHKSSESFAEPFTFNPSRFIHQHPGKDQFSPFGLGSHSCPFAQFSINMSSIFIKMLAMDYKVEAIADGPPIRARYHWQPAEQFSVRLTAR